MVEVGDRLAAQHAVLRGDAAASALLHRQAGRTTAPGMTRADNSKSINGELTDLEF